MITFADDKMVGFTKEYTDQFKHKCGTCFSSGPVDVGVVVMPNGKLAYTCAKCVAKQNAATAQEIAIADEIKKKWSE